MSTLESAKADATKTMLRDLPKVELHRHLECSLRVSTLLELAKAAGLKIPENEEALHRDWLVTEPMSDLQAVLQKFTRTQSVLQTADILTQITAEAIEDAVAEGIRILELRYSPTYTCEGHPQLSFPGVQDAILKGIKKTAHLPIAVGLIILVQRTRPVEEAGEVIDFAIARRRELIGLDLADNEFGFDPAPFAPHFQRGKKAGLHVTIHSGEADFPESASKVCDAISMLGAERIGHGVQIAKSEKAMDFVRNHKVPLELCPTSNWLTNAVSSVNAHPFRYLRDRGILTTLNSDDPGLFNIDLSHEFEVAYRHWRLSVADLEAIGDLAAAASFIPLAQKQKFWPRPIDPSLAPLSNPLANR